MELSSPCTSISLVPQSKSPVKIWKHLLFYFNEHIYNKTLRSGALFDKLIFFLNVTIGSTLNTNSSIGFRSSHISSNSFSATS